MDSAAKSSGVPFSQAKEDEPDKRHTVNCVVGLGKLLPHTLAGDREKPVEFALVRRVIVDSRQPQGNEQ